MPQYSKTTWVDGTAPAISAANLNKLEQGVFDSIRQDGSTTMSAQFVTISGSAATPAIAPTGDANTGIFFPAADTIAFGEGGLEVMRITSAGNVGIGTTAPSRLFELSSTTNTYQRLSSTIDAICGLEFYTNSVNRALITGDGNGVGISTITSTPIIFKTNSTEKMRITDAGNVGIGVVPNTELHVKGTGEIFRLETTAATGDNFIRFYAPSAVTQGYVGYTSAANNNMSVNQVLNADLLLHTNNTERMRITSAGNVGIGTTSPLSKLHVAGPSGVTTVTGTSVLGLTITAPASTSDLFGIDFTNGTNLPAARIAAKRGATGSEMYFGISNVYASGITNQAMMIDFNGFLLVGYTSSNGAYPLQVNGQIFATSSTIATSDGRYKKDVVALDGALDIVTKLNPVQFNWKEHPVHKFNTDVPTVGFIAQEVAEVLKDKSYLTSLIKKSECTWETETGETVEREVTRDVETQIEREITEEIDGAEVTRTVTETVIEQVTEIVTEPVKETHTEEFLGIAESNMIAILTKAIQELNAKVEALEAQLAK